MERGVRTVWLVRNRLSEFFFSGPHRGRLLISPLRASNEGFPLFFFPSRMERMRDEATPWHQ